MPEVVPVPSGAKPLVSFTRCRYSRDGLSVKGLPHDLALILARDHGGSVWTSTVEVYDDGTEILRPWRLITERGTPSVEAPTASDDGPIRSARRGRPAPERVDDMICPDCAPDDHTY